MAQKNEKNISPSVLNYPFDKRCGERGDEEGNPSRDINIIIENVENVNTAKVKEISVKVEFAGNNLFQSDPIPIEQSNTDVNLKSRLHADEVNSEFLDDILSNPIVFTVYDNSSGEGSIKSEKDAKVKSSRSIRGTTSHSSGTRTPAPKVLGICNLDIGSFLTGKTTIKESLILESDKKVPAQDVVSWVKLPRLAVVVTTGNEPLVPSVLNKQYNAVGITIESVYNPPSYTTEGSLYTASIPVPNYDNKNNNVLFPNGLATATRDLDCRRKWLNLLQVEGRGGRSKQEISTNPIEIVNPFPCTFDLRTELEKPGLRIQWNTWRNCLLTMSETNYMFSKIMKYRLWPIEVNSMSKPSVSRASKADKKSKFTNSVGMDTNHFTAFLNLSSLLYPGVTKARVAAQLYTYSQADLVTKFGAEFQPLASQPSSTYLRSESSKTSAKEFDEFSESPGVPLYDDEGSPVFIIVEVELLKPFTPKRERETLDEELRRYLSIKAPLSKKAMSLERAKEDYTKSIKRIVSALSQEYKNFVLIHYKNEPPDFDSAFHEFLNHQPTFERIRCTLENSIFALVDEKFGNLSQYNEMLKITNTFIPGRYAASASLCGPGDLQLFAEEAIEEEEFEVARDYLLLKISREKLNPDNWLDYAIFCVKVNDYETAVESVREALSLDMGHQMALLMYACLMEKMKKENVAELTFQVLLSKFPDFVEGWIILHMFYTKYDNFEGSDVTFRMAAQIEYNKRYNVQETGKNTEIREEFNCVNYLSCETYKIMGAGMYGTASYIKGQSWTDPLSWTTLFCPVESVNLRVAVLLLKLGIHEFASMALAKEILSEANKIPPHYLYYLAVSNYLEKRYTEAICNLELAVEELGKDYSLWSLMGHCYHKLNDYINSIPCYEYVIDSYNRPDDIHLIYLRMGYYYLNSKKYSCAKQTFACGCKYSPSPKLWLGAGIACLKMNEYVAAETAFTEANYLDSKNPESWAYLALLNAILNKGELFKQCYVEAKKRNLNKQDLLSELQSWADKFGVEKD